MEETTTDYFNIHDANQWVASFLDGTLPEFDWTHEAHLMVGLWMVTHHTNDEALEVMRVSIKAYNLAVGKVNSDTSGYHETITRFWMAAVPYYLEKEEDLPIAWDQSHLEALLFNESLTDRNLWKLYYLPEQMMSNQARLQYLAPTLQDFPSEWRYK